MKIPFKLLCRYGLISFLGLSSLNSYGSAFQIYEQNGSGTGDYHAGGAAEADDASTGFYNPAGLVRIDQPEVVLGGVSVFTHVPFNGQAIVDGGANTTLSEYPLGSVQRFIPMFHFATPINDKWFFGFGVTTPFGAASVYSQNSVAADAATKTEIQTINFSPVLAYKVNDKFSVGAGIDEQLMNANFDSVVLDTDRSYNSGSSWATGWHAGLLYQFDEANRVGLSYHSRMIQDLHGSSVGVDVLTPITYRNDTLNAKVYLPAYTLLSFYHAFTPRLAGMLSTQYTQWHTLQSSNLYNVINPTTGQPGAVALTQGYKNTWNFAAGLSYQLFAKLKLKTGIGYDMTPTQNAYRDLRLPDANRYVFALGTQYQYSKNIDLDLGWAYIKAQNATINTTQTLVAGANTITMIGNSKSHANIVGGQITIKL